LEVLIIKDFKSLFSEVLILGGLKPLRMSEMREVEKFSEVLILEELRGEKREIKEILRGEIGRDWRTTTLWRGEAASQRGRNSHAAPAAEPAQVDFEMRCSSVTIHDSTNANAMSTLSLGYSKTMGLNAVNPKDFAARVVDRDDGDSTGACVPGNVPDFSDFKWAFGWSSAWTRQLCSQTCGMRKPPYYFRRL
jgi:hypothetical protein